MTDHPISVLCVDDNEELCKALGVRLRDDGFRWCGYLTDAGGLPDLVQRCRELDVVLMDLDMPGPDPFAAIADLATHRPNVRALIFSGHVRSDLVDRAVEAGAWGYVCKSDGEEALVRAIHDVMSDRFALSPQVETVADLGV